jgi:molecular chaperone GrpE
MVRFMADANNQKGGEQPDADGGIKRGPQGANERKKADSQNEPPEKKIAEYENDLKRLQAEFENFQKRAAKEKLHAREAGRAEAVMSFISLYDELSSACAHAKNAGKEDIVKGIELLHRKMGNSLTAMGVREIAAGGEIDPHMHEVLMREEGGQEGHVAKVLRKGYCLGENLIRPAQVSVYAGEKKDSQEIMKADGGEAKESREKVDGTKENGKNPENKKEDGKKNSGAFAQERRE